jgi:hypothetical protein
MKITKSYTSPERRRWEMLLFGFAKIIDGLILVLSLNTLNSDFGLSTMS